jgi:uncharacterized protein
MTTRAFLGQGWRSPIAPDPRTRQLAYVAGADAVRQAIVLLLETDPGERIMRPDYGCGLRRYLMRPNSAATRALIAHDVEQALARWEPRIAVNHVRAEPGDEPSLVVLEIAYTHMRDRSPGDLVYPFYLE